MAKTKTPKLPEVVPDWPALITVENMCDQRKEFQFIDFLPRRRTIVVKWGAVGGEVEFKLNSGYLRPRGILARNANWRLTWECLQKCREAAKARGYEQKKLRTKKPYQKPFGAEIADLGVRR